MNDESDSTVCQQDTCAIRTLALAAALLLAYATALYFRCTLTLIERLIVLCGVAAPSVLIAAIAARRLSATRAARAAALSHVMLGGLLFAIPVATWHPQLLLYHIGLVLVVIAARKHFGRCIYDDVDNQTVAYLFPSRFDVDLVLSLFAAASVSKLAWSV